ncbi:MAG: efflux RND transporter periplasmic adaptor subunit [Xanthobacteraceae bacterium]|nr:efflux RND transporter periplasmic adaptor subunit [Xanthobacteraceae bacterium]
MLQKLDSANLKSAARDYFQRPRRKFALAVLLVAVIAVMAALYLATRDGSDAAIQTAEVTKGDIERTVTALASIKPKTFVDVGTQVSGQLRKVHVEIGQVVEKGALLAEIDPIIYQAKVLGDRAQIENLKAQLAQARAQLVLDKARDDRTQRLFATNAASKDAAEATAATVKIDEAKIDSFAAQIKQTEATLEGDVANLGYTKIYAPMSGTIVQQIAYEGQTLNASQTAPIIVRIADLDTMTVWAQVAEAEISRIKPGMPVYFTTLGMSDRRFNAVVSQIYPTPDILNDVVLYNVLIDVPNKERLLMTSMTAQVFFVLGSAKDVVLVPMAALRPATRGESGSYIARVATDDGIVTRRVKIGLSSRQFAEVLSGLSVGDKVVVAVKESATARPQQSRGLRKF